MCRQARARAGNPPSECRRLPGHGRGSLSGWHGRLRVGHGGCHGRLAQAVDSETPGPSSASESDTIVGAGAVGTRRRDSEPARRHQCRWLLQVGPGVTVERLAAANCGGCVCHGVELPAAAAVSESLACCRRVLVRTASRSGPVDLQIRVQRPPPAAAVLGTEWESRARAVRVRLASECLPTPPAQGLPVARPTGRRWSRWLLTGSPAPGRGEISGPTVTVPLRRWGGSPA
jgi:hypothetical protein